MGMPTEKTENIDKIMTKWYRKDGIKRTKRHLGVSELASKSRSLYEFCQFFFCFSFV